MDLRLYFVTDEDNPLGRSAKEQAEAALKGGATTVQLRCKRTATRLMLEEGRVIKDLCRQHGASFVVNDRIDVAWALKADGVHLGWDDMPVDLARSLLGEETIVGLSVSSLEEARRAIDLNPAYLGVGPIYATSTKPDAGPPLGPDFIRRVRAMTTIPIVAIGGISVDKVPEIVAAGANGVAVITAISRSADMVQAAATLRRVLDQALGRGT
jgi:thiamine-phosphate diphosphorylase